MWRQHRSKSKLWLHLSARKRIMVCSLRSTTWVVACSAKDLAVVRKLHSDLNNKLFNRPKPNITSFSKSSSVPISSRARIRWLWRGANLCNKKTSQSCCMVKVAVSTFRHESGEHSRRNQSRWKARATSTLSMSASRAVIATIYTCQRHTDYLSLFH